MVFLICICVLFRLLVFFIFLLKYGLLIGKIEWYDNCSLFIKGYCFMDLVRVCLKIEIYFFKWLIIYICKCFLK